MALAEDDAYIIVITFNRIPMYDPFKDYVFACYSYILVKELREGYFDSGNRHLQAEVV